MRTYGNSRRWYPAINTWGQHYQQPWREAAADRELPDWLRVASLAFGCHEANGHAVFGRGEIAGMLGPVDRDTGEIKPMDRANVRRAIRTAIQRGFLAEGSQSMCLIVPAHWIVGGVGNSTSDCPIHQRGASRRGRSARPELRVVGD